MDMQEFLDDRKNALLSMDRKVIGEYATKHEIQLPENEDVFWNAIHKARTGAKDLPLAERLLSAQWLAERGLESMFS